MSKMADKLYGDSPKLERDEGGSMKIKKSEKKANKSEGEDIGSGDSIPVTARHSMERMEMHHKHMRDQHTHDVGKHGDKKEMHSRHMAEVGAMYKRHEKEMGKEE